LSLHRHGRDRGATIPATAAIENLAAAGGVVRVLK
jgi:hypothetical protein